MAFEAGRLMLQRIDYLLQQQVDFAFETTLSTRSYVHTIRRAREVGYVVSLYYFWLPSAEVSKQRVAQRVANGGHNIPSEVVERRYERSLENLKKLYIPICDYFSIFSNASPTPQIIASGGIQSDTEITDGSIWRQIHSL
ncbi:zeta toxin family protein [Spirosoma montaniterrae]|uniref:zeta toxin family protein n=1 Tax=Spirosoma montaniterrae TaxID=1178516 RepID=UPI001E431EED|nr:zeta toxin family protein [Spirosoma montaniterrae]